MKDYKILRLKRPLGSYSWILSNLKRYWGTLQPGVFLGVTLGVERCGERFILHIDSKIVN